MSSDITDDDLNEAIALVGDKFGLPSYYRSCVKPIVRAPREQWPGCCGSNCDPCNGVLVQIADEVLKRLGTGN